MFGNYGRIMSAHRRISCAEDDIREIDERLTTFEQSDTDWADGIEKRLDSLEADRGSGRNAVSALEARIARLEAGLRAVAGHVNSAAGRFLLLSDDLEALGLPKSPEAGPGGGEPGGDRGSDPGQP